jgi:polysaccharide export outer membrane protein
MTLTRIPTHPSLTETPRRQWLGRATTVGLALAFGPLGMLGMATPVQAQQAGPAASTRDYVIGPGDVLRISVYQSPDLLLETRVNESGTVSYPLLGQIRLGGLSTAQAEKLIGDGLRNGNFLRNPSVSVVVLQVRGNQASVLGMVNKPGRYPIEVAGLRLSELIATAGGIAIGGSDIVTLTGSRNGKTFRQQYDLAALLTTGDINSDPVIQNGDTAYVDRMPIVYVYGEVQRPGAMRLERDMSLMQALAAAGGLTPRGTDKGIRLSRRQEGGQVRSFEPDTQHRLQDGDVIYVRASLF